MEFDAATVTAAQLVEAVEDAGFDAAVLAVAAGDGGAGDAGDAGLQVCCNASLSPMRACVRILMKHPAPLRGGWQPPWLSVCVLWRWVWRARRRCGCRCWA